MGWVMGAGGVGDGGGWEGLGWVVGAGGQLKAG